MRLCSVGDVVKLIPDPRNQHDRNAIRVLLTSGHQIGYISARQAARFAGKVHLLTATVHSRVQDEWGNDTIKLRVVNSAEQKSYNERSLAPKGQSSSLDVITAIQDEAKDTAKTLGWSATFVYLDSEEQGRYQVLPPGNTTDIQESIQTGLVQRGFIGGKDATGGIEFGFALNDGLPLDGSLARRFQANASEWVVNEAVRQCAARGIAPPVVHKPVLSERFVSEQRKGLARSATSTQRVTPFGFGFVLGIAGLLLGLFTGEWRMTLVIVLFGAFTYVVLRGRANRVNKRQ